MNSFSTWKTNTEEIINRQQNTADFVTVGNTIRGMNDCLNEKMASSQTLLNTRAEISQTLTAIESDKESLKIAQARVLYSDEARRPVSHYESWFPLGRPLKPFMIPLLIGLTATFAILGLFLLLSLFGLEVTGQRSPITNPILLWLGSFGRPFWIVTVLLVAVSSAFIGTAIQRRG
jgi:hypothetical protein